jgi:hypothetical protein
LSDPFKILKGGAQGGLSVPWVFLCCLTEILAEDDGNRLDLDFAIRRECLRLECQRSGSDRWFAGGTGIGEREAAVLAGGAEIDEGELRWNGALRRGGLVLREARKQAQVKLDETAGKVANLEMRQARWVEDDDPEAKTAAGQHETSAEKSVRVLREAVAAEEVMGEKGGGKKQTQKRLQLLHEVRLPDGVVEQCQICDAAIPYVGFCGECTGLKLDLPAKGFL